MRPIWATGWPARSQTLRSGAGLAQPHGFTNTQIASVYMTVQRSGQKRRPGHGHALAVLRPTSPRSSAANGVRLPVTASDLPADVTWVVTERVRRGEQQHRKPSSRCCRPQPGRRQRRLCGETAPFKTSPTWYSAGSIRRVISLSCGHTVRDLVLAVTVRLPSTMISTRPC